MCGGPEHHLAYITDVEAGFLLKRGGLGQKMPGTQGVRCYATPPGSPRDAAKARRRRQIRQYREFLRAVAASLPDGQRGDDLTPGVHDLRLRIGESMPDTEEFYLTGERKDEFFEELAENQAPYVDGEYDYEATRPLAAELQKAYHSYNRKN
jgi:hypothetical protein